jgi:hypothetical protein
MFLMSLFDVCGVDPKYDNHNIKWFIYLTNWTFFMAFCQTWLASIILFRAVRTGSHNFSKDYKVFKTIG